MSQLIQKKMVNEEQFLDGLKVLLDIAEDLLVDIPKFWDFLAQIISPVFSSACVNMKILLTSADCLMSDELARKCAACKNQIFLRLNLNIFVQASTWLLCSMRWANLERVEWSLCYETPASSGLSSWVRIRPWNSS